MLQSERELLSARFDFVYGNTGTHILAFKQFSESVLCFDLGFLFFKVLGQMMEHERMTHRRILIGETVSCVIL